MSASVCLSVYKSPSRTLEQVQKGDVDVGLQEVESLSPQDLSRTDCNFASESRRKDRASQCITWRTATDSSSGEGVTSANSKGRRAVDRGARCWSTS